jgi:hypothetical protein
VRADSEKTGLLLLLLVSIRCWGWGCCCSSSGLLLLLRHLACNCCCCACATLPGLFLFLSLLLLLWWVCSAELCDLPQPFEHHRVTQRRTAWEAHVVNLDACVDRRQKLTLLQAATNNEHVQRTRPVIA